MCGSCCDGPKRCCASCRGCVHRAAPIMKGLSLTAGGLMLAGGIIGALSLNPFTIMHGFFLAVLGLCVIGGECQWEFILLRAPFLSTYAGKGLFFLYLALPLVEDGWAEYNACLLWWRDLPCPTTRPDPQPDDSWLERLLVHSRVVQFVVGVALVTAGLLKLLFAATGPPPVAGAGGPHPDGDEDTPTLQSRRGSDFVDPLLQTRRGSEYSDAEAGPVLAAAKGEAAAQEEIERLRAELAALKAAPPPPVAAPAPAPALLPAPVRVAASAAVPKTYAQQQEEALLANLNLSREAN